MTSYFAMLAKACSHHILLGGNRKLEEPGLNVSAIILVSGIA